MCADALINVRKHFDFRSMSALRSEIKEVLRRIPSDFGRECSLNKAFLMAELIRRYGLQMTVDIGVYRSKSLFPQALAHRRFTGGVVHGINPWCVSEAREYDNPALWEKIDQFIDKTNFQAIYEEVEALVDKLHLKDHCILLRRTSADAIIYFQENGVFFDLVHIDGNHDTEVVMKDLELYLPRLNRKGFIILDDISWDSVKPVYQVLTTRLQLVYKRVDKTNDYALFWNSNSLLGTIFLRLIASTLVTGALLLSRMRRAPWRMRKIASCVLEDASTIIENHFLTKKRKNSLVIFDDIFPHLLSAFRVAEYNRYLETWKSAVVYSTVSAFSVIGEKRSFREVVDEYKSYYPHLGDRVFKFNAKRNLRGELAYTVFLGNAFCFIDVIEKHHMPFVFTLYPGAGFRLNEDDSDRMLERVCSSPNLKRVIVTQKVSYEYLKDWGFCDSAKVEFIYGGVLPSDRLTRQAVAKKYYKQDKDTFDVCFVANKYMERGIDKGYDVFIQVARLLSKMHQDIFFHVVGSFDASDIDVSDIKGRIKFYGTRNTDFFPGFYSYMDIILSPNCPFLRSPGAFDGFPTGCCVEAGSCGVAVFCTDILGQNVAFKNDEEIVIISRDIEEICGILERYHGRCDDLYKLSKKGQEAFRRIFDIEVQTNRRLQILSQYLGGGLLEV